jgi:hypothetical protein
MALSLRNMPKTETQVMVSNDLQGTDFDNSMKLILAVYTQSFDKALGMAASFLSDL